MKWTSAILIAGVLAMALPLFFGGAGGPWLDSWFAWGTVRPVSNSPGLLFSLPIFGVAAFGLRSFFEWHSG
ncbi:hypothetical protein [Sphingomicrobium sediminis]|uniref:Uncharacterized protein n=1 Tax=Sphingomicrobium sediminis TaxID=2950949 RepID=A0A9X2J2X4_9SPHN|nr:hypothetical protein [Sphingomicrobium sediminis]MCM8557500.1 hypothetical protein [Sphingomicrobium sediminis]